MFKNLQIKKVDSNVIKTAGSYSLMVTKFAYTNSFEKNFDHERKEGIDKLINKGKLWAKACPQLAVTLGSTENKGVITVRFQGEGYMKVEDPNFDESILDNPDYIIIDGYVCLKNEEGLFERVISPEKTQQCENIAFGFFNKLGFEDESVDVALANAIKEKRVIIGEVTLEDYEGRQIPKIEKWIKVSAEQLEANITPEASASDFSG